jgi:hypothetical protein
MDQVIVQQPNKHAYFSSFYKEQLFASGSFKGIFKRLEF